MRAGVRHWRVALAFLVAALGGIAAWKLGRLPPGASWLVGYDAGAAVFLAATGALLLFDGEDDVRRRAAYDDENVGVMMALVLGAVLAGFAAVIVALREGNQAHGRAPWLVGMAISTLVQSWLVVQSLFALHYAHRYFGDGDDDGEIDGGIQFTGDPPRSYRDFIYVSVCMGATCQVSDFAITTGRFRNLITVHALVAFGFNTLILALGVGIAGSLLSQ